MQHLDEGTIHAWLDGELPPAERAAAEAHLATCDECKAAVAEARGFMAASSRILTALDAVPGGVLPASSAASMKMRSPARFTISRAWMAAAAVLVLSTSAVIAVRPKREAAALRVAEADKKEKATSVAPMVAAPLVDSVSTGANAVASVAAPAAPAENLPATAPASQRADEVTEVSPRLAGKLSKRAEIERKDSRNAVSDSERAPMMVADAARAQEPERLTLSAPKAIPPGSSSGAQPVTSSDYAAPPVAARAAPLMMQIVTAQGVGIQLPDGEYAEITSHSAERANGDSVVTTIFNVHAVHITLVDKPYSHDEVRRVGKVKFGEEARTHSRDSMSLANSITWISAKGRLLTLSGTVMTANLEQLKSALIAATP